MQFGKHVTFPVRAKISLAFAKPNRTYIVFTDDVFLCLFFNLHTRRVEHKNVLSVLGQATEQEPFLVILEHSSVVSNRLFQPVLVIYALFNVLFVFVRVNREIWKNSFWSNVVTRSGKGFRCLCVCQLILLLVFTACTRITIIIGKFL